MIDAAWRRVIGVVRLASPGLQSGEVRRNRRKTLVLLFLRELKFPARRLQESAILLALVRKHPVADGHAVLRQLKLAARRLQELTLVCISASRECQLAEQSENRRLFALLLRELTFPAHCSSAD